ncbi:LacI family DNA-binding transcriptional regulator [Lysobacter sp. Root690]|uniref:LacI family DNA-binding transcriptional regulator n=1 Tax=Lysobacter sp. Root690 TaxID=1736588 RepID=UPI0006FF72D8|nr:LacI family DNA-binding transcriptional regulator [Lysobacter sp. Root690]KRB07564.1 LacI family transcriptional regulator [Lysobacter sp. Root690]
MRVRIEDVAEAAGVSMKTVSRVLNQEPNVSEDTRKRVEAAARKLQYRPNPSARSLAGQRSYLVALLYDNPSSNYLMEVQAGMLDACIAHHYNLMLAPVTYGERKFVTHVDEIIQHSRADGLVLTPPLTDHPGLMKRLGQLGIPYANISPKLRGGRIGVVLDEERAVREMMAHLVSLGHRRIAHIKGHPEHGASQWRLNGYRDGLAAAGIEYDPSLVIEGDFHYDTGAICAQRLLLMDNPPTAIFAANDDMAAGTIRTASEMGLSIPGDVSVCGFDDTPISRQIYPPLTTVRQPTREMGRLATHELFKRIKAPDGGQMITAGYELQLRQSTGPIGKGRAPRRR